MNSYQTTWTTALNLKNLEDKAIFLIYSTSSDFEKWKFYLHLGLITLHKQEKFMVIIKYSISTRNFNNIIEHPIYFKRKHWQIKMHPNEDYKNSEISGNMSCEECICHFMFK